MTNLINATHFKTKNKNVHSGKISLYIVFILEIVSYLLTVSVFIFSLPVEFAYLVGGISLASIVIVTWYILTIDPKTAKIKNNIILNFINRHLDRNDTLECAHNKLQAIVKKGSKDDIIIAFILLATLKKVK